MATGEGLLMCPEDSPWARCDAEHLQWLSCVWLFATPKTIAHQAPLSMGFPRQEYWSGLPCPSPGDLPNPGIRPSSPAFAGRFFTIEPPGKLTILKTHLLLTYHGGQWSHTLALQIRKPKCQTHSLSEVKAENQTLDSNLDCLAPEAKLWPPGKARRKQHRPQLECTAGRPAIPPLSSAEAYWTLSGGTQSCLDW